MQSESMIPRMRSTRREALAIGLTGMAGCVRPPRHADERATPSRPGDVSIGFVGDVMLGRGVTDRWAGSDHAGVWGSTIDPSVSETRAMVQSALLRAERHDPDLVVASLHWGPNWVTAPKEHHEAFGRWLVDEGVDVVHGHSAHVLQGVEVYRGSPILYDTGDFVDDFVDMEEVYNKRSGLFELHVDDGGLDALSVRPTRIVDRQAQLADGEIAAWVRDTIRDRSAPYGTTVDEAGIGVRIPLDGD